MRRLWQLYRVRRYRRRAAAIVRRLYPPPMTHYLPPDAGGITACCGRSIFELHGARLADSLEDSTCWKAYGCHP